MKMIQIDEGANEVYVSVYVNPDRVTFLEQIVNGQYGDHTRIWFGKDDWIRVPYPVDEVARILEECWGK